MKTRINQITASLMLAALSLCLPSCQHDRVDTRQEPPSIFHVLHDGRSNKPNVVTDPTGNFGGININPATDLSSNTGQTGCFPASSGWDRYYATGWFLGPGATANPNNYPNTTGS